MDGSPYRHRKIAPTNRYYSTIQTINNALSSALGTGGRAPGASRFRAVSFGMMISRNNNDDCPICNLQTSKNRTNIWLLRPFPWSTQHIHLLDCIAMRRSRLSNALLTVAAAACLAACDSPPPEEESDAADSESIREGEQLCADLMAHSTECGVDPRDTEAVGRLCDDLFVVVPLAGPRCIEGVTAYFECLVEAPCGSNEVTICRE